MQAVDALETALSISIDDRRDIPKPSTIKVRQPYVTLPALTEAKIGLYQVMSCENRESAKRNSRVA